MSDSSHQSDAKRPAINDSPWFWVLLFALAGLVALLIISSQYARRQRRLEMQYQAREEMTRRQVVGEPKARERGDEGDAPPPALGELIIPLWPVGAALLAVAAFSAHMLARSRRGIGTIDARERKVPP